MIITLSHIVQTCLFFVTFHIVLARCQDVHDSVTDQILIPNLPLEHYKFWIKNHPRTAKAFAQLCQQTEGKKILDLDKSSFQSLHKNISFEDPRFYDYDLYGRSILESICDNIAKISKFCWGYERDCHDIYMMPECLGLRKGEAKDEQEQKITWFNQADFGYILQRRMEMSKYCSPDLQSNHTTRSALECTTHFRTCRGAELMMKFNKIPTGPSLITSQEPVDVLDRMGGWNCDLQLKRILEQGDEPGALQSWYNEFKQYKRFDMSVDFQQDCDIREDKTTILIKLDSTDNMYHLFCNFINLYATMHMNQKFYESNQIVVWDNKLPGGKFESMWKVFSKNRLKSIDQYAGKRVCFKRFIASLLPRMVDGLYYNTNLISGCRKSGLFHAFNRHVLHKFETKQSYDRKLHLEKKNSLIRVSLIQRSTTRVIKNIEDLKLKITGLSKDYLVQVVKYEDFKFEAQLGITYNTDILVGIHGAGLTHTLFLPDWAAVLELHDCKDKAYKDLTRLRGVEHFTPKNETKFFTEIIPSLNMTETQRKAAAKFSDYSINPDEFLGLFTQAVERVRKNRLSIFGQIPESSQEASHLGKMVSDARGANSRTEL